MDAVPNPFNYIPFSTPTWVVLGTLAFFLWLFARASRNPRSAINWEHLLLDDRTGRTSPYKLGHLIGIIVGTWIMIRLLDTEGALTFDMLGVYFLFLLGGSGISTFVERSTRRRRDSGDSSHDPDDRYDSDPWLGEERRRGKDNSIPPYNGDAPVSAKVPEDA